MDLFTLDNLVTLFLLILLQAVLGFDNLLYISLESKRAPAHQQAQVRKLGIGIAIGLRLILLFGIGQSGREIPNLGIKSQLGRDTGV